MARLVTVSRRRSPSSTTGIAAKNARCQARIGVDVALDESRRRQAAARARSVEQRIDHRARLVAQAAVGAAVQDEVGEGSVGHRGRIVGEGA